MEITQNKTTTEHSDYMNFYQILFKASFLAGDTVQILINDVEQLAHTFLHSKCSASFSVQDKSEKLTELTEEQKEQALQEFRERNNL